MKTWETEKQARGAARLYQNREAGRFIRYDVVMRPDGRFVICVINTRTDSFEFIREVQRHV